MTSDSHPHSLQGPPIHVAAGAIFNDLGQVLLSLRPQHVHQGGLWEFPGGKIEAGEQVLAALTRELREELGIDLRQARPLIRVRHDYGDRCVLLDIWRVERFEGQARGREGQQLAWVEPEDLPRWPMPAADLPIVDAVRLPSAYLITGADAAQPDVFMRQLERRLDQGIRLVQLRAKTLPHADYRALARRVVAACHARGARLLLNADPALVTETGADGVHLSGDRLARLHERPLARGAAWVAASCHDLADLEAAQRLGVDFVVVSPVQPTASHPGAAALGWDGLVRFTEQARVPVYALGGMTPGDLERCHRCGAQGIAAIRALWED
jgi:8-oxo-dGTP diphosphatase